MYFRKKKNKKYEKNLNDMEKINYLLKNVGFLTISQLGSKLLSLFLVPLYTSVLTTQEYGTYDLINTIIIFLIPVFTVNIKESSIRFVLEPNYNKTEVFSISIVYCIKAGMYALILIVINIAFDFFDYINDYKWFILLLFVANALNEVICNFARGLERIKDTAISSLICSATIILLNIVFLIFFDMGLIGYLLANFWGLSFQSIFLFLRFEGWKYIKIGKLDEKVREAMLIYTKPLIVNSTAWWINSASDRLIIIYICGVAVNGVYSVAGKIPSILNIFQNIFNQAWTLSAVKEFKSEGANRFMSTMFNMYNLGITSICSILIVFSRVIARALYAKDFFEAWQYVPFLLIAVLFGALSGYTGGIFSAVKISDIYAYSTVIGAALNMVLNVILIRKIGAIGAAISTALSYCLIYVIRLINVNKIIRLEIDHKRNFGIYVILFLQAILVIIFKKDCLELYAVQCFLFFVIMALFYPQLKLLVDFGKERLYQYMGNRHFDGL